MLRMLQPIRFVVSLLLLTLLMTACGGGGGSSTNASSGTGKASILLTDRFEEKITDRNGQLITSAKEIWVTFSHMSLKMKEGGWIPVFSGPPNKSIDLLTLHGRADLVALVDLPPGNYDKARIKIEEAWFIDSNGDRQDVIVPSQKITIKFKRHLVITADNTSEVLFDFVPGKSIRLIETGNGKFILRPVIRVRVNGEQEAVDFVKIEGRITSVDCSASRLTLDPREGDPITVDLEDALVIQKDGSFHGGEDDSGEHHKGAALASCQELQKDQVVEVIGTSDDNGVIHASVVEIEESESAEGGFEFTGTLLKVDCDPLLIRVGFSGGEIDITVTPGTAITADGKEITPGERCDRLKGALQKRIEVEGKVVNNQVVATEITLPSTAPVSMSTRVEGTAESVSVSGTEVTGFILKTSAGKLYTVTIDTQTEIKDQTGSPTTANALLNHSVRVEGKLDTTTTPNPTIKATDVVLLL